MKKSNSPIFSIIMPAYNADKKIKNAIDSVINQDFYDYELIIVDDGSTDNTWSIIEEYVGRDDRIKGIKLIKNIGVARARNIALEESQGRYISFLDSDDIWKKNKLSVQHNFFEDGFDLVFSGYVRKTTKRKKIVMPPKEASYNSLLKGNYIGNLTGAYDREKIGLVYQKQIGHEDYLMWLDITKKSKRSCGIQKVLAEYNVCGDGISSNKIKAIKWMWNIYRFEIGLNFFKSLEKMFFYIFYAIKKR